MYRFLEWWLSPRCKEEEAFLMLLRLPLTFWRWITFRDLEERAQRRAKRAAERSLQMEEDARLEFDGVFLLPGYKPFPVCVICKKTLMPLTWQMRLEEGERVPGGVWLTESVSFCQKCWSRHWDLDDDFLNALVAEHLAAKRKNSVVRN